MLANQDEGTEHNLISKTYQGSEKCLGKLGSSENIAVLSTLKF